MRLIKRAYVDLESKKKEAQHALEKLQQTFTSPEECPSGSLHLIKYTLRGVCPTPYQTYILVPNGDQTSEAPEQWWLCSWNTQPSNWGDMYGVCETVKTSDTEALRAAQPCGDTVLLIYANDRALEGPDLPLPEPLEVCVPLSPFDHHSHLL